MENKERLVPLNVRIEASTVAALEALAEREERSFSDVVRRMLRRALEDKGGHHDRDPAGAVAGDDPTGDHRETREAEEA